MAARPTPRTLREALAQTPKRSKYRAVKTVVDGFTFDSKREATAYRQLKLQEILGWARKLKTQVTFDLEVNGQKVCAYVADFTFDELLQDKTWRSVVADAKGFKTPTYRLKKKLMKAVHGIEIREL